MCSKYIFLHKVTIVLSPFWLATLHNKDVKLIKILCIMRVSFTRLN